MELTKEQIKNMQEGLSNPVPWDSYVYATAVSNLLDTIAARDAEIAALRGRMEALVNRLQHDYEKVPVNGVWTVKCKLDCRKCAFLAALDAPLETGKPTDEELSKGTFSCPVCGVGTPHSVDAHPSYNMLPEVVYGVPSYDKTFLVWTGTEKHKAISLADFSRNVIEYRRVNPVRESIERIARQAEELGEYDKFVPPAGKGDSNG
jgi:hypothetical protein